MPEIMRKRAGVLALVGELITRRMPKHMRMNLERKLRSLPRSLDHSQEPSWRYWSASLGDEHIGALAL